MTHINSEIKAARILCKLYLLNLVPDYPTRLTPGSKGVKLPYD